MGLGDAGGRTVKGDGFGQFFWEKEHLLLVGGGAEGLAQAGVQDAGDALHAEALGTHTTTHTQSPPGDTNVTRDTSPGTNVPPPAP